MRKQQRERERETERERRSRTAVSSADRAESLGLQGRFIIAARRAFVSINLSICLGVRGSGIV
jgi:hypothetical protein